MLNWKEISEQGTEYVRLLFEGTQSVCLSKYDIGAYQFFIPEESRLGVKRGTSARLRRGRLPARAPPSPASHGALPPLPLASPAPPTRLRLHRGGRGLAGSARPAAVPRAHWLTGRRRCQGEGGTAWSRARTSVVCSWRPDRHPASRSLMARWPCRRWHAVVECLGPRRGDRTWCLRGGRESPRR
ncbi:hypothetical protein BS78_10G107300 [Paspalum vaginatum]|nr:hypothetical protein BS78_10G107300 [Paspalum vaginatum]